MGCLVCQEDLALVCLSWPSLAPLALLALLALKASSLNLNASTDPLTPHTITRIYTEITSATHYIEIYLYITSHYIRNANSPSGTGCRAALTWSPTAPARTSPSFFLHFLRWIFFCWKAITTISVSSRSFHSELIVPRPRAPARSRQQQEQSWPSPPLLSLTLPIAYIH